MFNHLYNNFNHWYQGGQIYFYSDPHFNDADQIFLRPDYIGDQEQVKSINSKIGKNDTIIILGDIGDISFVKKIRGYKILIMGNHDSGISNYIGSYGLFNEAYEGPLFISDKILLSHEPIDYPYALNIHGHDHSNWTFQDELHINMCAEHINYTPVPLKDIIRSGKLKNIKNIHRSYIDGRNNRITNNEALNKMSIEDKAKFLAPVTGCDNCPLEDYCIQFEVKEDDTCEKMWRQWLNDKATAKR